MHTQFYHSPAGSLLIAADSSAIRLCDWAVSRRFGVHLAGLGLTGSVEDNPSALTAAAAALLDDYFAGLNPTFDLPLSPYGTDFRREVWNMLHTVPYGATASYGDIARALGRSAAVRAVAAAIAANPVSIFIPCHRIVGAGGAMTGYAGSVEAKRLLLGLEAGIRI